MSGPVVADLHVHTTASDGTLDLESALGLAAERGLEAIAITDHDRLHPELEEPMVERNGLTIIRGIELKVECRDGWRIDLLGYGLRKTDALDALIESLQRDRVARARRIRECLERELDVTLALDLAPGIGRPHLARAAADHPDVDMTVQDVFDRYVGDGRPCFVARDVPTFAEARSVLTQAAAVTAVAHPLRYDDVDRALALARELGALERRYPYEEPVGEEILDRVLERCDLLVTGGSDAHDETIGAAGLYLQEWHAFREALEPTP